MCKMIKVGSTELIESEIEKIYTENKYVVNYSGVYAIYYSTAQKQYYSRKVIDCKGMTKRGRFYIMTAEAVNHTIGKKVLNED